MGMSLHYSHSHASGSIDCGAFLRVQGHRGCDRVDYVDVLFSHARLAMTGAEWRDFLARNHEEVVALMDPDLSGARADIPEVGA